MKLGKMREKKRIRFEDNNERGFSILRYVGQNFQTSDGPRIMTLSILEKHGKTSFNVFQISLKSLGDITKEEAFEVYKIAAGSRGESHFRIREMALKYARESDKPENQKMVKELEGDFEVDIHEKQFHIRGGKMFGNLDFWHGHEDFHFGYETENPSSYAEYSVMEPHAVLQYLEGRGYMIPYNRVDLFEDGIAKRIEIKKEEDGK